MQLNPFSHITKKKIYESSFMEKLKDTFFVFNTAVSYDEDALGNLSLLPPSLYLLSLVTGRVDKDNSPDTKVGLMSYLFLPVMLALSIIGLPMGLLGLSVYGLSIILKEVINTFNNIANLVDFPLIVKLPGMALSGLLVLFWGCVTAVASLPLVAGMLLIISAQAAYLAASAALTLVCSPLVAAVHGVTSIINSDFVGKKVKSVFGEDFEVGDLDLEPGDVISYTPFPRSTSANLIINLDISNGSDYVSSEEEKGDYVADTEQEPSVSILDPINSAIVVQADVQNNERLENSSLSCNAHGL